LFFIKDKVLGSTFRYLLLLSAAYLLIVSFGTKHLWYDAPLYPALALITAMGIFQWIRYVLSLPVRMYIRLGLVILIITPLISLAVHNTKRLTFASREREWMYEEQGINYYLRDKLREDQKIQDLGVAHSGYHSHIRFYLNLLNESGSEVYFVDYRKLEPASTVIACEKNVKDYIELNYDYTKVFEQRGASIYRIGHSWK
jgi:hypothetical protein